jgi:hypothetical protein
VMFARWPPDRYGFVPLKRPQRADSLPCPIHTRFEQLRFLRRVVHGSCLSHVTRRDAKRPSSPLVPGPQQLDNHQHREQLLYRDEIRAEYARGGVQRRISNVRNKYG